MEISDSGMSKIYESLGGGPVRWVVQDYRNYSQTESISTNKELSISLPSKFNSLRSLFVSFREKYAGASTFSPLDSTHYNLSEYTFRLGSKTVPTKAPASIPEFFGELLRAIGSVSDLNHEPSINLARYNIEQPIQNDELDTMPSVNSSSSSFYVGIDLESYSSSGIQDVYQGYNSSTDDIFFNPRFGTVSGGSHNVRIDAYAYFDQVITIENGFATVNN